MKIGIFAKTFAGSSPMDVLSSVKQAGFHCAQYNMACSGYPSMPDAIDDDKSRAVGASAGALGIEIAAVSGTYNMIHPDKSVRRLGQKGLAILAEHCRNMSTNLITLCTGTKNPHDQWAHDRENNSQRAWQDLLCEMEVAVQTAEQYDIFLGIEPELANVVSSAAKARQLISDLQSKRLKIVFDPANLFEIASIETQRKLISEGIDLLADRIIMAHAKDRDANGSFVAAGKGIVDFPHLVGCLRHSGFDGNIVAHGLDASEAGPVAAFLESCAA